MLSTIGQLFNGSNNQSNLKNRGFGPNIKKGDNMKINYNETIKEIRAAARKVGLTFKKVGATYTFYIRGTDDAALSGISLNMAYENVCSGYISSWNGAEFKRGL